MLSAIKHAQSSAKITHFEAGDAQVAVKCRAMNTLVTKNIPCINLSSEVSCYARITIFRVKPPKSDGSKSCWFEVRADHVTAAHEKVILQRQVANILVSQME
jgi:hypothetical protein